MSPDPGDPRHGTPPQQSVSGARPTRDRALAIGLGAAVVAGPSRASGPGPPSSWRCSSRGRHRRFRAWGRGGEQAEVFFLQLMTDHHEGGVTMAEACVSPCTVPVEKRLASGVAEGRQSELGLMRDMLAARGARPRT